MGKIKCPYCFEEFESDKVLFRANTGFTQEELDREEFTSGDVDEHKRLFVKFPKEIRTKSWTDTGRAAEEPPAIPVQILAGICRISTPMMPTGFGRCWTLTPTA